VTKKPFPLFWAVVTLAITSIGLVWGGRNTYVSLRNPSPVQMTCGEFIDKRPDVQWVQLRECDADLQHIDVETTESRPGHAARPTTIYIPLRSRGAFHGSATLLLASDKSSLIALGEIGASNRSHAELEGIIEGTVELAIDRSARDRELLQRLDLNLRDDFLIVDHNTRPRARWLAIGVLGIGVIGLTIMARWLIRRRQHRSPVLARAVVTHE
jgi:hypothetical protein